MFRAALLFSCASALVSAGCANGNGVTPRGDGGHPDAAVLPDDASPGTDANLPCDPACLGSEVCIEGVCHPGTVDLDHDGIPAATDCDDSMASVGTTSERTCSSSCGMGVERCTDGAWGACTAPTSCDCTVGEPPRMIACARCGMQQQICESGVWTDAGSCTGSGPCSPGAMDMGGTCGMCGTQTRICQADCTWGAWQCMNETGVCTGTMTDSATQACGVCGTGTQMHTRTCDAATCQWGAFGSWSTCSGGTSGVCSPGQTDMETRACPGGCANQTRTRSCDTAAMCNWGAWSSWSSCPTCGPVCGNSTCESGETCSSCADCHYGHLGPGAGGDSCAGVPAETWRCVHGNGPCGTNANVSQVCRGGVWVNYNCSPRNCAACVCTMTIACSQ